MLLTRRSALSKGAAAATAATLQAPAIAYAQDPVRFLLPAVKENITYAPYMLAQTRGFYRQEGLDVEFLTGRGRADVAKQIGAGNADFAGGLGDTSIVVRSNGVPVRTVAVCGGGGLTQLLVREDAGIAEPRDLRGKSLRFPASRTPRSTRSWACWPRTA